MHLVICTACDQVIILWAMRVYMYLCIIAVQCMQVCANLGWTFPHYRYHRIPTTTLFTLGLAHVRPLPIFN